MTSGGYTNKRSSALTSTLRSAWAPLSTTARTMDTLLVEKDRLHALDAAICSLSCVAGLRRKEEARSTVAERRRSG